MQQNAPNEDGNFWSNFFSIDKDYNAQSSNVVHNQANTASNVKLFWNRFFQPMNATTMLVNTCVRQQDLQYKQLEVREKEVDLMQALVKQNNELMQKLLHERND